MTSLIWRCINPYLRSLDRYPITTQYFLRRAISGGLFGALADYICQSWIEGNPDVGKYRVSVVGIYGSFEVGIEWLWTRSLDAYFGKSMGLMPTVKKTLVDNFLFQPFELELFFSWVQIFERPKETLWEKTSRDLLPSFGYSFLFWFPLSFGMFYYIPLKYRVVASDVVCVLWDIFITYAGHNNILQSSLALFGADSKEKQPPVKA
jgi:hypothetical protein